MPRRHRLAITAATLLISGCGSSGGARSRINAGATTTTAPRPAVERQDPTAGLQPRVSGGADPLGQAKDTGSGLTGGVPGGRSGGGDPASLNGTGPGDGTLSQRQLLALLAGELNRTYTVTYQMQPALLHDVQVSNAQPRQAISAQDLADQGNWTLAVGGRPKTFCHQGDSGWSCKPVDAGNTTLAALDGFILSPAAILAVIAPAGMSGGFKTTTETVAGVSATCITAQSGNASIPSGRVCVNADGVPVFLHATISGAVVDVTAASYRRGVDTAAFNQP